MWFYNIVFVAGIGIGNIFGRNPITNIILSNIPPKDKGFWMGINSGLGSLARVVGPIAMAEI